MFAHSMIIVHKFMKGVPEQEHPNIDNRTQIVRGTPMDPEFRVQQQLNAKQKPQPLTNIPVRVSHQRFRCFDIPLA
jgi:hypothetical protein